MNTTNGLNLWVDNWDLGGLLGTLAVPVARARRADPGFGAAYDVDETDEHYLLSIDLPGMRKEDLKIEIHEGQLAIAGERKYEGRDRQSARFQRTFALPTGVDADKVEANYQDGVLRVLVPKAEAAKPRQIKITNGNGGGSKFFGRFLSSSEGSKENVGENRPLAS